MRPTQRLRTGLAGSALLALVACSEPLDFDLRDLGDGFDTSAAVQALPDRPEPDERGVISYPNYQVVVARRGDTVRAIAGRLGVEAEGLARYNAVDPDVALRRDEIIALPARVGAAAPTSGLAPASGVNVTTLASNAIDRAEAATPLPVQPGPEPTRHQVQPGETVFSIARQYGVPVSAVADWNGLSGDMTVQAGRFLLIPDRSAAPQPAAASSAIALSVALQRAQ